MAIFWLWRNQNNEIFYGNPESGSTEWLWTGPRLLHEGAQGPPGQGQADPDPFEGNYRRTLMLLPV